MQFLVGASGAIFELAKLAELRLQHRAREALLLMHFHLINDQGVLFEVPLHLLLHILQDFSKAGGAERARSGHVISQPGQGLHLPIPTLDRRSFSSVKGLLRYPDQWIY